MRPNIQGFSTTADVLNNRQVEVAEKPIYYEFQYYGNFLAEKLNDQAHTTLYMKLAKETDRALLEQALEFVRGVAKVKNRAGLFMWKLSELKRG
jgi:hypothetical protein